MPTQVQWYSFLFFSFSVYNDTMLPKLASTWLTFDGFSPESMHSVHRPNNLQHDMWCTRWHNTWHRQWVARNIAWATHGATHGMGNGWHDTLRGQHTTQHMAQAMGGAKHCTGNTR